MSNIQINRGNDVFSYGIAMIKLQRIDNLLESR
jgi:hypothetical protein